MLGYTRLFHPDKPVTKARAAIALATGEASDIVADELARIEAESMAEFVPELVGGYLFMTYSSISPFSFPRCSPPEIVRLFDIGINSS